MKFKKTFLIVLIILVAFIGILKVNAYDPDAKASDSNQLYNVYENAYKIVAVMNYYYDNAASLKNTPSQAEMDNVWTAGARVYNVYNNYVDEIKDIYNKFNIANNGSNFANEVLKLAKSMAGHSDTTPLQFADGKNAQDEMNKFVNRLASITGTYEAMKVVRDFMQAEANNYSRYASAGKDALLDRYNAMMNITKGDITGFCDFLSKSSGITTYIQRALKILSYIALALAVILGAIDFAGAITSNDDAALKKAFQKFTKRLIAVALIFLTYVIVRLVLNLAPRMPYMNNKNFEICDELKIGGFNGLNK